MLKPNILILSSLYPVKDYSTNTTPVVHSFAKEWVKLGFNVKVIHNENKYLLPLYYLPKFLKQKIEAKFGVRIPSLNQRKPIAYFIDGVLVYRLPILKSIPFGLFPNTILTTQGNRIIDICLKDDFVPNVIIGHWEYPQIPLITLLKKTFTAAKTCIVFHGITYVNKYQNIRKELDKFDYLGFRSLGIKNTFTDLFGERENLFLCYSGIPDKYAATIEIKNRFKGQINKFSFVGLLIQRKFPDIILRSIMRSPFFYNFKLNIVGEGSLKNKIESDIRAFKVDQRVKIYNKLLRDDVITLLRNSDCFIMVSRDEAFGLVYLEAMLAGCIVIASKNEGMDGIIIDSFNGFLIDAGNETQLITLLNKIYSMELIDINQISKNAIETVMELTDSKVAVNYLKNINILN